MLSATALDSALQDLLEHHTIYFDRLEHALQVADRVDEDMVQLAQSCATDMWKLTVKADGGRE